MADHEHFRQQLQDALAHLYDPSYRPEEAFCRLVGSDPRQGAFGVQSAVVAAIAEMSPGPDVPLGVYPRLIHELLHCRFVLKLTQEETARRLNISVAKAWRVQREAVHALAKHLLERGVRGPQGGAAPEPAAEADRDWQLQVRRELAALDATAPHPVADVGAAIADAIHLASAMGKREELYHGYQAVQPGLVAAVHPSVLRQMLLTALTRLGRCAQSGPIGVFAGLEEGNVRITFTAPVEPNGEALASELVRAVVKPEAASVQAQVDEGYAFLSLELPSVGRLPILVVDDNLDTVDLYRRSVEGTHYFIVHAARGEQVFEAIEAARPRVIVLDVMLPDMDGWSLLLRLYENPSTHSIPVIVCSVVREEELALQLGAALYLSKPVRPEQFRQALDRVLGRAPSAGSKDAAHR